MAALSVHATPARGEVTHITPAATSPAALAVRDFTIEGNHALSADQIRQALLEARATGEQVGTDDLRQALRTLRDLYRAHGYPHANFRLPRQRVSDGIITLHILEGEPAPSPDAIRPNPIPNPAPDGANLGTTTPASNARTATPPPSGPAFEVRRYDVVGNTLLRQDTLDAAFAGATGTNVTFPTIQSALGRLQLAYRERGYASVSVTLPRQQLTHATVQVQVIEGLLTSIQVTGNRHFSEGNIRRALPSLRTNEILNSRVLQRELDIANQNRDRQIFPTLGPGPEPGTSALTLRVKDRLPLHGRLEINNQNTPGTPDWRVNSTLQYANLWQLEHQVGLQYAFSPDSFRGNPSPDYLLNRPLIANLGAYYRLPFGNPESVQDRIESGRGFGFDEASRQFRLPPPGGRPELSIYASTASTDTGVQFGPATTVSQTPLLTIVSQDTGQNLSVTETVGARVGIPLALGRSDTRRFSISVGPDLRRFSLESFNTNNFIITTVVTNAQGSQTIESRVASPQPARDHEVTYLPLALTADATFTDPLGTTAAAVTVAGNPLGSDADFAALAYSRDAAAGFAKVTAFLSREQKLPAGWSLLARAAGQAATGPLLGLEQFSVGGLQSVRGYFEGDEFGDAGWFTSLEARTPFLLERVAVGSEFPPVWIRGSAFVDAGQRFLLDSDASPKPNRTLMGAGFGLSANLNNRVDLRLLVGWPFFETPNTPAGTPRVYFSLGGQF